jgi:pyruvate dehydrogenase E2 component (dihydrolipoamide acetyltransferase)
MATEVPMPKLGLTMEEAMIIEWLVADGDEVAADTPIALIETDKTETEVGSPGNGRLHQIGQPGEVFACGVRIAVLLEPGENPPAATAPAPTPTPTKAMSAPNPIDRPTEPGTDLRSEPRTGRLLASPNARRVAAERGVALASVRGTGPGGRIVSEDVEAAPTHAAPIAASAAANAGAVATAAARQLADLLGIDLTQVAPDPREHRITREGVALHVRQLLQQRSAPEPGRVSIPLLQEPSSTIKLTGMRGTIAKRMRASLHEMAQLTLTMDAAVDAVLADRADRKRRGDASVPSITDYVVAATARALVRHPGVNAQITDAGIALLPEVHVGLAVAVDGGLMVPVIRHTAHRDLADLAAETTRLAAAARAGSLKPGDLDGGTFSVSALGAYGVDVFTPVINPPNAGILGVGRIRDELVVTDGNISTRKVLTLSLTWDHRVLDGVPAAEFTRTIVELLSDPSAW